MLYENDKHSAHLLDLKDKHNAFCINVNVFCKSGLLSRTIIHTVHHSEI